MKSRKRMAFPSLGNRLPRALFLALVVALLLLSACDALPGGDNPDQLEAAGVVEAVEIVVAPELGGRVAEVFVSAGDSVAAGDRLFRLEDDLLAGQRRQAEATLEAAQAEVEAARAALAAASARSASADLGVEAAAAGLEMAEAGVRAAEAQVEAAEAGVGDAELGLQMAIAGARQASRGERVAAWDQELPDAIVTAPWYFQEEEELAAAEREVEAARTFLQNERADYAAMLEDPRYEEAAGLAVRLVDAQAAFLVVQELLARDVAPAGPEEVETYRQELYDAAEAELEAAQSAFDEAFADEAAAEILQARARLAVAKEQYDTARDRRDALLTGENSLSVRAAQAAVGQAASQVVQAGAGLEQAKAARHQARVAVAQAEADVGQVQTAVEQAEVGVVRAEKAVAQAQAALDLLEIQAQKLVVHAAIAGTVMTRDVQPGEILQPGMVAMTLANLDALTVTVYLPENQYGRVSLGDGAQVTVDSFPDETFAAEVVRIADEAEFTPRNVQTEEERQTTVYAVELALSEGFGRLKPGMPADVVLQ